MAGLAAWLHPAMVSLPKVSTLNILHWILVIPSQGEYGRDISCSTLGSLILLASGKLLFLGQSHPTHAGTASMQVTG